MPRRNRQSSEFERIARYFAPLAAAEPGALGLRDDAAFLTVPRGRELVVTTDAIVAGVHFLPGDPPDLIARKALRVNLSDLAGKGATPRWYLLDAAFPIGTDDRWIAAFARGLARDQKEFGIRLVGGDTVATPGPATFAVTAFGEVNAGRGLRRSGARRGDDIYVTGTIGDSALGLLAARGKLSRVTANAREFLVGRYRLPRPRTTIGPRLTGIATAAMDVSDGLVADLGHIAETSKLRAVIWEEIVPLSPAAKAVLSGRPNLIDRVLTGGDDYEILFTAPPSAAAKIKAIGRQLRVAMTRIGHMEPGRGVAVHDRAGKLRKLSHGGWVHG